MCLTMLAFKELQGHESKYLTERINERTSQAPSVPRTSWKTTAVEVGYGIGGSSLFAGLWQRFGPKKWPVMHGMLFSMGLWFLSSKAKVPHLPSREATRGVRLASGITSHLIYGAVLGAEAGKIRQRG